MRSDEQEQAEVQPRRPFWMILAIVLTAVALLVACLMLLVDPESFEPRRSKFGLP